MKNLKKSFLTAAMVLTTATAAAMANAVNDPQALKDVQRLAISVEKQGQQPVAIFDLDDTLLNTRERNLRIINEFLSLTDIQNRYPQEVQNLQNLKVPEIQYLMADTLKNRGVTDAAFLKEISDFWLARFFTNEYCSKDRPNPGAVQYVRRLYMAGVKIVYLTGRDVPRMHDGTAQDLRDLGFPVDDERAILIMKPSPQGDDLEFKKAEFPEIAKMGRVIGVFENEPANINAHHEAFPEAVAIFVDTIHSPKPDVPEAGVRWVEDFRTHH